MTGTIVCSCCGQRLTVTPADIGESILCPKSRQLIRVEPGMVEMEPTVPLREGTKPSDGQSTKYVIAGIALVLLLGLASGLVWFRGQAPNQAELTQTKGTELPLLDTKPVSTRAANEPAESDPSNLLRVAPEPEQRYKPKPYVQLPPPPSAPSPRLNEPTSAPPSNPDTFLPATKSESDVTPKPSPKLATTPTNREATAPKEPSMAKPEPAIPKELAAKPEPKGTDEKPSTLTPPAPSFALSKRIIHKRIDSRTTDELEKELLAVREVSLDEPFQQVYATLLVQEAKARKASGKLYPGPALLAKRRSDLAELPFILGPETVLGRDAASNLDALSVKFRAGLLKCIAQGDPRPNSEMVQSWLLSNGAAKAEWRTAAAVPCLRQMLPGELADIRRIACEVYRGTPGAAATEALVAAAVFDTDFETRNAAVAALAERNQAEVVPLLLKHLEHPWMRAVEHAVEALIALEAKPAIGWFAVALERPHPTSTATVSIGASEQVVRQELVKMNHARNCLLCHAPSFDASDKVRASVPDPTQPLSVAAYYSSSQNFVRADTTFLRQDFSVVQPVANPGPWPAYQRYDYLVVLRKARADESPAEEAARKQALRFGLKELSGKDLGNDVNAWVNLKTKDAPEPRSLVGPTAQLMSLQGNPAPLLELHFQEFGKPFLAFSETERKLILAKLRRFYGEPGRLAMVAYLEALRARGTLSEEQQSLALVLLQEIQDVAAWGRPISSQEYRAAMQELQNNNDALRRAAGYLVTEDVSQYKSRYRELLSMLQSPDDELRVQAAIAFSKFSFTDEEIYIALARAARDPNAAVRQGVLQALQAQPIFPQAAGEQLTLSLLAKLAWAEPSQQRNFQKSLVTLLKPKMEQDTVWVKHLINAALGELQTDTRPEVIAQLLGQRRKLPTSILPDCVKLLSHPVYGGPAANLLLGAPRAAFEPVCEGLSAANPSDRAAAAQLLGKLAKIGQADGVTNEQYRLAMDQLSAMVIKESDPEARAAARIALSNLTANRP